MDWETSEINNEAIYPADRVSNVPLMHLRRTVRTHLVSCTNKQGENFAIGCLRCSKMIQNTRIHAAIFKCAAQNMVGGQRRVDRLKKECVCAADLGDGSERKEERHCSHDSLAELLS